MTLTSPDVLHDQNIIQHLAELLSDEGQRRVHYFDDVPARDEPLYFIRLAIGSALQKLGAVEEVGRNEQTHCSWDDECMTCTIPFTAQQRPWSFG